MMSTAAQRETRIGPYVLKRALGKGGSGHTYLAWKDNPTDQKLPCAIKLPHHDHATSGDGKAAFWREARMMLRLGAHPNIVQVFDVGLHEGSLPYLAMEYIDGLDLGALLKIKGQHGRPLSPASTYNILVSVAAALHHAHSARTIDGEPVRIVHRDVTPSNIVVNQGGVVKLLDFGIGVAMSEGTTDNHLRGKYRYMSPEHLDGTPCPEMDIYSLGVVAWEMVENRVFRAECEGIRHMPAIIDGQIPPMRCEDRQLVRIITACLSRHARSRPTAAELGEVLTRWARSCGYDRDPSVLEHELAPILGPTRPSGASKQNLVAPPELLALLAAVKQAAGGSPTTPHKRTPRDVDWEVLHGQHREEDAPRFFRRLTGSPLDPERPSATTLRVVSDVILDVGNASPAQAGGRSEAEGNEPELLAPDRPTPATSHGLPAEPPADPPADWRARLTGALPSLTWRHAVIMGAAAALLAALAALVVVYDRLDEPEGAVHRGASTGPAQGSTSSEGSST